MSSAMEISESPAPIEGSALPHCFPCLLLDWRKATDADQSPQFEWTVDWICEYKMLVPVHKHDVRNEGNRGFIQILFNTTWHSGGGPEIGAEKPSVSGKDASHIQWDALTLRLPAYVRYGSKIRALLPKDMTVAQWQRFYSRSTDSE